MKVKDFLSKIVDSYVPIEVAFFDKATKVKSVRIEPHSPKYQDLTEDMLEKNVILVIPFYNMLQICVDF